MNLMTIMLRLMQFLMGLGILKAGHVGQELLTHVEPIGKVLDVIKKFSQCKNCQEKKRKYDAHQMTIY